MPATTVARSPTASSAARNRSSRSLVGQRRALAGRAGNDDPVGAVVDEVYRELLERVEVDCPVRPERGDDRGQDVSEHAQSLRRSAPSAGRRCGMDTHAVRFVLVHGAWHGAWCFEAVGRELSALGHEVVAPNLPCDDISQTQYDYARLVGPQRDAVVVGHSTRRAHGLADRGASPRLPRGDPPGGGRLGVGAAGDIRRLSARRTGPVVLAGPRDGADPSLSRLHRGAGCVCLSASAPAGTARQRTSASSARTTSTSPACEMKRSIPSGSSAPATSISGGSARSTRATRPSLRSPRSSPASWPRSEPGADQRFRPQSRKRSRTTRGATSSGSPTCRRNSGS